MRVVREVGAGGGGGGGSKSCRVPDDKIKHSRKIDGREICLQL